MLKVLKLVVGLAAIVVGCLVVYFSLTGKVSVHIGSAEVTQLQVHIAEFICMAVMGTLHPLQVMNFLSSLQPRS